MAPNPTIKLASGASMPTVGFGLWKVPKDICADIVYNAIKTGYRLFDGAYDYQNEKEAGQGIKRAIDEGLVKREDIFVTTKLWNNYHAKDHALTMAKAQNDTWGLGYIDLFLIHFPVSLEYISPKDRPYPGWWMDEAGTIKLGKSPINETWSAMEEIVDLGIAKSIGVSNFQAQMLYDLQAYAKKPVSSLQVELHPYLVQDELVKLAQSMNIAVTAYSSFGPMSYHELGDSFAEKTKGLSILFEDPNIIKIAKRNNVTPSQVLLRWATQRNIAVIPKSNNQSRLKQNLEAIEFDLTEEEIKSISSLDKGLRFNDPGFYLKKFPLRIFA